MFHALMNALMRPAVNPDGNPNFNMVKGQILGPGAEAYAYLPKVSDPIFLTQVHPGQNFATETITSSTSMDFQYLSVPYNGQAGNKWYPYIAAGLIDQSDYPGDSISGDFWE
jgi:hypothetical protein